MQGKIQNEHGSKKDEKKILQEMCTYKRDEFQKEENSRNI